MRTRGVIIDVGDHEAPTLVASNPTVGTDYGQCSAVVWLEGWAWAWDNCSGVTLTFNPGSGTAFPKGTTSVTVTAEDEYGNSTNTTIVVTVQDQELPVISGCPSDISTCPSTNGTNIVTWTDPTATDNCAVTNISCSPTNGWDFPLGETTVTCTATDSSGNTDTRTFKVIVQDVEPPAITCPQDIFVCADPSGTNIVTWAAPTATDNCAITNVTCNPTNGSNFPLGETIVTCTATDVGGNQTSCTFKVNVLNVTVTAENNLTECMEGRWVTFTATASSGFPHGVSNPIEFTFHFQHADGTPWTATDWSWDLVEDHIAVADDVPDGDADHKFTTPIYVDASNDGITCTSPTIYIDVYELWIEYFRDDATSNAWKVVVGRNIAYSAIASSDCTSWAWDMQDGVPDVWQLDNATSKQGTSASIPNSKLPTDDHWNYFGDAYGTVDVFCEDGEGNNHHFYSTSMSPAMKARVYFEKDAVTNPGGSLPNWFYYWRKFVPWGRIATLNYDAGLTGYASTDPMNRVTTISPLASQLNDETTHRGIHTFYETLAHESHHIDLWEGWWGVGGAPVPANDTDADTYPDSWESTDPAAIAAGFVVGVDDNYSLGAGHPGYDYEEAECRAIERALNSNAYDGNDWSFDPTNANQGKQW